MELYDENYFNKTDLIYKLGKCQIEFFSLDNANKVRGSKRDYLFLNEITDDIIYDAFFQLNIRTKLKIIMDYNPSSEGWWTELRDTRKSQVDFMISTYKDNPFLSETQIEEIEMLKETDDDYWNIYGVGVGGNRRDVIFQYTEIDSIDKQTCQLIGYGIDFGFSKDPATVVAVYQKDNNLYVEEEIYETNLTNDDLHLSLQLKAIQKDNYIVADSAEPKSIEELRRKGWKIYPAKKGPDSIRIGIDILKRYKLHVTSDSLNLIKELRHYKWKKDANGVITNVPTGLGDHAIDAMRYVALNLLGTKETGNYNITIAGSGEKSRVTNEPIREIIKRIR
jgi:phage terminase large subunit